MNTQDQNVRRAIWEVYNCKCFYTGDPLGYSEMELDHIIPVVYRDKPYELHKILKDCGLDDDFHIDSLYNLVPTSKLNNGRKSDMQFEIKSLLFWFGLTKKNVSAIEKRIIKLKKRKNYDEHLSMLKTQIDDEKDGEVREKLLVDIISFISNENEDFIEQEEIYEKENEQVFKKYKKSIGLEAIMPRYNNPETECVLYFRTLKARDCMLVLDNKIVLSQLFSGLFTDPKYGARGFLEYDHSKHNLQESINFDNINIHLGSNRLKLSKDDIYLLCAVIDSYAIKYIESLALHK